VTTRHVLAAIFIVAGMLGLVPTMVEASPGVRLIDCSAAPARPLSSSDGQHLGIIYPRAVGSCVGSARAVANDNESLYGSKKPQLKINGGEVMGTSAQPGAVTLIPVTWVPKSSSMASDYQAGFASFDAALAADSAKPTNVFAIGTQYTDARGRRLLNQFTAAEPIVDSAAYPAARLSGGCTVDTGPVYGDGTGYTACLTDVQIATELSRLATTAGLAQDRSHLFSMILPRGVEVCFGQRNTAHGGSCTLSQATTSVSSGFCAYHSTGTGVSAPTGLTYTVIPFGIWNSPLEYSCEGPSEYPSGNSALDIALSTYSHEVAEAITDPTGNGWHDVYGNENGDLCNSAYGTVTSPGGQGYNQVIGSGHYLLQLEFSNAAWSRDRTTGCQARWNPPAVSLVASGPAVVHKKVTFTAAATSASAKVAGYAWSVDGRGQSGSAKASVTFDTVGIHTVTVTVTDTAGWLTTSSLNVVVSLR